MLAAIKREPITDHHGIDSLAGVMLCASLGALHGAANAVCGDELDLFRHRLVWWANDLLRARADIYVNLPTALLWVSLPLLAFCALPSFRRLNPSVIAGAGASFGASFACADVIVRAMGVDGARLLSSHHPDMTMSYLFISFCVYGLLMLCVAFAFQRLIRAVARARLSRRDGYGAIHPDAPPRLVVSQRGTQRFAVALLLATTAASLLAWCLWRDSEGVRFAAREKVVSQLMEPFETVKGPVLAAEDFSGR